MTGQVPSGSGTAPLYHANRLGTLPVMLRLLLCSVFFLLYARPEKVHASRQDRTEVLTAVTPPVYHQPESPLNESPTGPPESRVRKPRGPQVSPHTHNTKDGSQVVDPSRDVDGRHRHTQASVNERRAATPSATADDDRGEAMHAVKPFVVHDAEVSDPVGEDVAAALQHDPWAAHPRAAGVARMRMHAGWGAEAGSGSVSAASTVHSYGAGTGRDSASYGNGRRGLLHGHLKPEKYTKCDACTLVSCNTGGKCTGHCKKIGKLFKCTKRINAFITCPPTPPGTPPPTAPDPLRTLDAVIVKAPTPYIGCADIANSPSGCPVPHTRGLTADGKEIRVRGSRCVTARYDPHCGSPFFPFGVCMCRLHVSGSGFVTRPCDTRELVLRDPPEDDPPQDVGIAVNVRGRVTYTGFSDYTDGDEVPRYAYDVKVELGGETVPVSMDVFVSFVLQADEEDVIEESEISEDYNYGGVAPADTPIGIVGPSGSGSPRSGGAKNFVASG